MIRGAAVAGVVGPALFALVAITLTVVQYDFMIGIGWHPLADPAGAWPSGLALGSYGWAQSLSFAASGLLLILFVLGLHRGIVGGSRAGPALLLLSGVAMALLAFETAPIIRTGPRTLHGWVHDLAFVLFIVSLVPSFFFLWRRMERDPLWRGYGWYTLITGLLAIPLLLLPGPTYYLSLALILAWLEVLA
ncbi:MAG TPA: DUF998 domain-containing protein, partial [Rubrobacteraceae bacterium]|nr:DUF998 domain-containing protein [Rubrobacteraceae bacterium]